MDRGQRHANQMISNLGANEGGSTLFRREPPGLHTTARELQTCTFQAPAFKNTTKIPREVHQKREERKKIVAGDEKKKKKTRNFGLPPFGAPPIGVFTRKHGWGKRLKHQFGPKSAWPESATPKLANVGQVRLAKVGHIFFGQSRIGQSRSNKDGQSWFGQSRSQRLDGASKALMRSQGGVGSGLALSTCPLCRVTRLDPCLFRVLLLRRLRLPLL